VCPGKLVFLAFTLDDIPLHFLLVPKVEGDRSVHLFEAQRRVMHANGFRLLTVLELPNDMRQRNTAPDEIETSFPAFDEFLHAGPVFSLSRSDKLHPAPASRPQPLSVYEGASRPHRHYSELVFFAVRRNRSRFRLDLDDAFRP
jgi:hypothetical protein